MIYQQHDGRRVPVTRAILHCADIQTGQFANKTAFEVFTEVNRWHLELGWKGFGYHGLVMPNGDYFRGRSFDQMGAHVKGHNVGTLGFLLIESKEIERMRTFGEYYTPQQKVALRAVLATIRGLESVEGHNQYSNKICPGFEVRTEDWL